MPNKTLSCLPILSLTLCLLPWSASAQDASRIPPQVANRISILKQLRSNALNRSLSAGAKANHVKANDAGSFFQVLHSFTKGTDGDGPQGGVNLDASGNMYGSTSGAGTSGDYGTLFKIDTAGNYTVLYDFQNGSDGFNPVMPPLPPDASGNMYGTACEGGAADQGTMFEFIPETSSFTLLDAFGTTTDSTAGYCPKGLISDSTGNLYGFTVAGGDYASGNVFEAPSGNLANPTNLYSFTGNSDGGYPIDGSLIMDASGNFYGTTAYGGNTFNGNVFELSPPSGGACPANSYQNDSNWCETVLYSFDAATDPQIPDYGVARDSSGNLYGTGQTNGLHGSGGVWKLTPVSSEPGGVCPAGTNQTPGSVWCETVLYNFSHTGLTDGQYPNAGVVLDSRGNLYGVTIYGGENSYGALYEITAGGQFTLLYSFNGLTDGAYPYGTPVLSPSGATMYGTTSEGGNGGINGGGGTVWSYAIPQPLTVTLAGAGTGTVTSSPAGISCPGTCSALFPTGTVVALTEVTGALSPFSGWSGACSGSENTCQVTMNTAANITATFTSSTKLVKPTVMFSGAPTTPAPYLSTFTVTAMTNASTTPTFTATGACSIAGVTVTMTSGTGSCHLEAKWAADDTYTAASATQTATAQQQTGDIDWTAPAAITYGTALSASELDATTNSNGKLVYTPKAGTLLTAGSQTLSVTLAATKDYTGATYAVGLTVNPIGTTTTITEASPNPAKVGQTVTVDFTVEPVTTIKQKPTGNVTVTASSGESCTGALLATGKGKCTLTFSSAGSSTLTATYAGDNNNNASTSGEYTETVN
jgi:uncharacterized repeat protein (TIGR03803 family)